MRSLQDKSESREMFGKVGTRSALLGAWCGAEAYLEPLLFDQRGNCELLRHGAR